MEIAIVAASPTSFATSPWRYCAFACNQNVLKQLFLKDQRRAANSLDLEVDGHLNAVCDLYKGDAAMVPPVMVGIKRSQ
jgi:hypothetical protein